MKSPWWLWIQVAPRALLSSRQASTRTLACLPPSQSKGLHKRCSWLHPSTQKGTDYTLPLWSAPFWAGCCIQHNSRRKTHPITLELSTVAFISLWTTSWWLLTLNNAVPLPSNIQTSLLRLTFIRVIMRTRKKQGSSYSHFFSLKNLRKNLEALSATWRILWTQREQAWSCVLFF